MTNYANKHFEEFIADGVLKEAISMQIPMSENMDTVNILEDFLKDFLREKKATCFKSLRVNCWEINQVTSKCKTGFFSNSCKNGMNQKK